MQTSASTQTFDPQHGIVISRGKDDEKALYDLLGNKDERKKFDTQFKKAESNFKIAIVVDMWLTGFDVSFLDTIYIDKPDQRHNLIHKNNSKHKAESHNSASWKSSWIDLSVARNSGSMVRP